ncbi:hypothetical protein ACFPOD_08950 [Nitratireductor kimnyeongensis]|uniref:Uncharacterized protein n=1 Tax=Nitratireductor kimnyeongensis TaxID=430679 RepID=A0ABW0T8W0_9HYPH
MSNLAFVQVREGLDTLRSRLGLLKPAQLELDVVLPSNTALVEALNSKTPGIEKPRAPPS